MSLETPDTPGDAALLTEGGTRRDAARVGRQAEPYVLLVLRREGRSYGYEIRARLEAFGFRRAAQEPGVMYRVLRRLEEEGSIVSEWDTEGTGPARRYYRLTERGELRLVEAAAQLERHARRIQLFFETYRALEPTPVAAR